MFIGVNSKCAHQVRPPVRPFMGVSARVALLGSAVRPGAMLPGQLCSSLELPESEVEPALNPEVGRAAAGKDSTDSVISETGGAAEHEGVAGLECDLSNRILALQPPEQKFRSIAQRKRDDRETFGERFCGLVLVLMESESTASDVVVDQYDVGANLHADRAGDAAGEVTQ